MKASTSPKASAISVNARRTVLRRERSAISSAKIGPEDDQPILTRSFSAGFVTGRFERSIICCFRCSRPWNGARPTSRAANGGRRIAAGNDGRVLAEGGAVGIEALTPRAFLERKGESG